MNHVSFPRLGLEFSFKETVSIFGLFDVYWYAIIIVTGIMVASAIGYFEFRKKNLTGDDLSDFILFAIPLGIIGARIYYVIFEWNAYKDNLWEIFAIWNGGLAIYGGIIVGAIVAVIFTRVKKIPFLWFADVATLGLFIAQSIGRWGNFVNAEAYGGLTDLPWGMVVDGPGIKDAPFGPCHPTFLYESLWNFAGFLISYLLIKRFVRKDGACFSFYLMWYGAGRFMIEGLREDSLYLIPDRVRVSQVVAIISIVIGLAVAFYVKKSENDR